MLIFSVLFITMGSIASIDWFNKIIKPGYREKLAGVKVFVDFWLGTTPKFSGNKVAMPA